MSACSSSGDLERLVAEAEYAATEAEYAARAARFDASLTRALAARNRVLNCARDPTSHSALFASTLAMGYLLTDSMVPAGSKVPAEMDLVTICVKLSLREDFEDIARETFEQSQAQLAQFVQEPVTVDDADSGVAQKRPTSDDDDEYTSRSRQRQSETSCSVTSEMFGWSGDVEPTGAPSVGTTLSVAKTVVQLAALIGCPMQAVLPFVVLGGGLAEAVANWNSTRSEDGVVASIMNNKANLFNIALTLGFFAMEFPMASNAPTWEEFLAQPFKNMGAPITDLNWSRWHPRATQLLPIIQNAPKGTTVSQMMSTYKGTVGVYNPADEFTITRLIGTFRATYHGTLGQSTVVDTYKANLLEWITAITNRKSSGLGTLFADNFYSALQYAQASVVMVGIFANAVPALPGLARRLRQERMHSQQQADDFLTEMTNARAALEGDESPPGEAADPFQERIDMVARKVVVDLAVSRRADHTQLRNVMNGLQAIRNKIRSEDPATAGSRVGEQEGALEKLEALVGINDTPPHATLLSDEKTNAFQSSMSKYSKGLLKRPITHAPGWFSNKLKEAAGLIVNLSRGRRADHDQLKRSMLKLVALRKRVESSKEKDAREAAMRNEEPLLDRVLKRIKREPNAVIASAYDTAGCSTSVVDALFALHVSSG